MDEHGYPEESDLDWLRNADIPFSDDKVLEGSRVRKLFEDIAGYFNSTGYGKGEVYNNRVPKLVNGYPRYEEDGGFYLSLVTGGWSGCEEMIGALRENRVFWSMYWFSSERGGRFTFIYEGEAK